MRVRWQSSLVVLVWLGMALPAAESKTPSKRRPGSSSAVLASPSAWDLALEPPKNANGSYQAGDTVHFDLNPDLQSRTQLESLPKDQVLELRPVGDADLQKLGLWTQQMPHAGDLRGGIVVGQSGEVTVPTFDIVSVNDGKVLGRTLPQIIRVTPADPNDPSNQPKQEVIPARTLPLPVWTLAMILGIAGLATVLILFFGIRALVRALRRRRLRRAQPIAKSAEAEFLAGLQKIDVNETTDRAAWKRFGFGLSELFRHYLSRRFQIDALESTSEELIRLVMPFQDQAPWLAELPEWLAQLDEVKFTEKTPQTGAAARWMATARSWVEKESRRAI